jgi:putative exosortase-associated protein (TIGR04073 family)
MRNTLPFLALALLMTAGCAHVAKTETKFGRGFANTFEIVRGGELRRTMEQSALFDSPDTAYSTGFFRGLNRTFARTGIGIYEMVSAPFPPHHPIATDHLTPGPVYQDSYKPTLIEDSMFSTDANLGFSGGDVAPMIPGSRFRIFDTH